MSDPSSQKAAIPAPSPFAVQMFDPKFQALTYDEQKTERGLLYVKLNSGDPNWAKLPAAAQAQAISIARESRPPAFSDPQYEALRLQFEDPARTKPIGRFFYSMDTQMGLTGLIARGVVNTGRALGNVVDRVGQFFGAGPSVQRDAAANPDTIALMMRAIGGDKDGVKLAQYLQGKYERSIHPNVPLIGGQTPTQLLGATLGFGGDLLSMKGIGTPAETAVAGATAGASPMVSKLASLGARAAITGTQGVVRGQVAEAVNAARPDLAPLEGATDTTHGIVPTIKSVGMLWGAWAAQDLAFGMLGQGAAEGLSRVGKTFFRALAGRGGRGLPREELFTRTAEGQYTPEALDLQRRFLAGNASPEAMAQLGPAARDYAQSYAETLDYSVRDPNALLNDPVAAWRVANQHMMQGRNTPLGIATVADGAGTWRVRTGLGKGGEILGEHLSFPEAEMVTHQSWLDAQATAKVAYEKWNAKFEERGGKEDLRQMQSAQLRMNALQDAFPHDRAVADSLTLVNGGLDRMSPTGAAQQVSSGAMLSYGEVGRLQDLGLNAAKANVAIDPKALAEVGKRGSLFNTDRPVKLAGTAGGNYNAAIVYAKAAPEEVWQMALAKADQYVKNGAQASREDLAYWELRDKGFDAIQHADGTTTALYPRQQIKHVTDFVNKSSREYTIPEPTAPLPPIATAEGPKGMYAAPQMLSERERADWLMDAAHREANTFIQPLPSGEYALHMYGSNPVIGSLETVTDTFLVKSTTMSHLRASLESEGMSLAYDGKNYGILDAKGKVLGSGPDAASAMFASGYRPKLLDGRFGPRNVEILPDGTPFEHTPMGVRGSLSDVNRYVNQFMDVAEEEGKRAVPVADGTVALGHDGAYTVEVPAWGIREKFATSAEAYEYVSGAYKQYDNMQRLANERGFSFTYDPRRGYVLSNAAGTYTGRTLDEVGAILAKNPDPRWAPGGSFDTGEALKNSGDVTRIGSDTVPNTRNTGRYYNRNELGQAISRAKTWIGETFGPTRALFARAEREYGLKGLSQAWFRASEGIRTAANASYLDAQKVMSIARMYDFKGQDTVVVDKIMQAISPEERAQVFDDFGIKEGSAKRMAIENAADRLRTEFYDKVYTRTGQNPDIFLKDYARKVYEYKQRNPQAYQDAELTGPEGMRQLIERLYAGRVPDDLRFQALHERVADMDGILKEENAFSKAILYSQSANRWAYSAEVMKDFFNRVNAKDVPKHVQVSGKHFIDEALNAGQSDAMEILRSLGKEGSTAPHRPLMSYLQTAAGMGTYGYKPSSALTILEHNYLVGTAFLGTEAMNRGFEASARGGVPHLQEQFQKGVFTGRIPVLYGFGDSATGSGWLSDMFTKAAKASTYFTQNGHVLGRSGVYDAASWMFDRYVKPWMDRGKMGDWEAKARQIKAFRLDPGALDQVKDFLDQGNYEAAKHAYATNMTDQIAFMFRPEDQGRALSGGMLAKMYGQLMIVPTHYAAAMARLASTGGFADRVAALSTLAKNTAAFYGANRAAGLSGGNLLPWRVVTLRGGPLWQAMSSLSTPQPGRNDVKTALKTLSTFVPGVPDVIQAIQVAKELEMGHPRAAFLTLNGFSVRPDLRKP